MTKAIENMGKWAFYFLQLAEAGILQPYKNAIYIKFDKRYKTLSDDTFLLSNLLEICPDE